MYIVAGVLHIGPGAAQFSSDPPGNHKFDPDSPENSWDPDPGLKNNARIGSRSRHDPRASGAPGTASWSFDREWRLRICSLDSILIAASEQYSNKSTQQPRSREK